MESEIKKGEWPISHSGNYDAFRTLRGGSEKGGGETTKSESEIGRTPAQETEFCKRMI